VASICENAAESKDFEILLRLDDDDTDRFKIAGILEKTYGVNYVVGPRGIGYTNMGAFVHDLVKIADSKWCWLFDDDAYVEGDWFTPLSKIVCDAKRGPAVNAEFYQLGGSLYPNGARGEPCGIIVPTEFCKEIPHKNPVDQQWIDETKHKGWIFTQLKGVTYHHDGRQR
jgi:hypothetical protein